MDTPRAARPYDVVWSVPSPATFASTTVEHTATAPPMKSASASSQPMSNPVPVPMAIVSATWSGVPPRMRGPTERSSARLNWRPMLNISSATPTSASARTSSPPGNKARRGGSDRDAGQDVAEHRRHAEPVRDRPQRERRDQRGEQGQLEPSHGRDRLSAARRVVGGMARSYRPAWSPLRKAAERPSPADRRGALDGDAGCGRLFAARRDLDHRLLPVVAGRAIQALERRLGQIGPERAIRLAPPSGSRPRWRSRPSGQRRPRRECRSRSVTARRAR